MDSKKGALYTILILGGIGLLAVSCSDSEPDQGHDQASAEHGPAQQGHASAQAEHAVHWGYEGAGGPANWGELKEEFALCETGKQQSPVDISTVTVTALPEIRFHYQDSPLVISNNGHTIKVSYAPGSYIVVDDKQYDLLQFHFHTPSEHTLGGKAHDMVAHLVHQAEDGQLGVIGIMFEAGSKDHETIGQLWRHMPKKTGMTNSVPEVMINVAELFPLDDAYYKYSGSLTTPPCSEGVNWMVMASPSTVSQAQVQRFADIFPLSTRPVQPLNGRAVFVSN